MAEKKKKKKKKKEKKENTRDRSVPDGSDKNKEQQEMEPKNHLDHPLQTCGQIYFNISHQKLVFSGLPQGTSKTKIVS